MICNDDDTWWKLFAAVRHGLCIVANSGAAADRLFSDRSPAPCAPQPPHPPTAPKVAKECSLSGAWEDYAAGILTDMQHAARKPFLIPQKELETRPNMVRSQDNAWKSERGGGGGDLWEN